MKAMRMVTSLFLASLMLLCSIIPISAESQSFYENKTEKITEPLKEKLTEISEEDSIKIWIIFKNADKSKIEKNTLDAMKTPVNKDDFLRAVKSANYSEETVKSTEELSNAIDEYRACYKHAAADVYAVNNLADTRKCGISNEQVIFRSLLTPYVLVNVPKYKVQEIAEQDCVCELLYDNNDDSEFTEEMIETRDGDLLDEMSVQQASNEFGVSGQGINVLILEAYSPKIDTSLYSIDYSKIRFVHEEHDYSAAEAALMSEIPKGSHSVETIQQLQEIAPNVNVFSVHRNINNSTYNEYKDIEWTIINKNIDVINCSGNYGFCYDYSLDIISQWFDAIVSNFNIPLMAAVGNDRNYCPTHWHKVHSVAAGYNTIGVGVYRYRPNGNPQMYDYRYSSYDDYPNAVQYKPDMVVAAGSTSHGSPKVAAIAALVLESNSLLKMHPDIVKAILMASCHEKALTAEGQNTVTMSEGLSLKQGAGMVNAYQAVSIALCGNYGTGTITSGTQTLDTLSIPENDDLNFSLVWLRENEFEDYDNNGYHDVSYQELSVGGLQELTLDVYENNLCIKTSNKTQAGKQLVYFPYNTNKDYEIKITKTTNNTLPVTYAYAWSPKDIEKIANVQITGHLGVDQTLTAKTFLSDNTEINGNFFNYQWYSSLDGTNWTQISGATGQTYQVSFSDRLKYIKCAAFPKDKNSILSNWNSGAIDEVFDCSSNVVIIYGDVNMDNHVSILDTTVIQQYVAGYPISLSDNQQRAADVNLDGSIDLSDATIIQKFSIGLIDSLPYVSP